MNEDQIKRMVDRFLGWKLPENFNPDGGISFERVRNKNTPWPRKNEPTGTNLLDADQAEAMVRYIVAEPSPEPEAAPASETQAPAACGALHTTTEGDVYACVRDSGHEDYHSSVRDSIRIAKGGVFWWDRTSRTQAPAVEEDDAGRHGQREERGKA